MSQSLNQHDQYQAFLKSKRLVAPTVGFDVDPKSLSPLFMPWQRQITAWALRRGRAGVFPDTGLGKTFMQLAIAEAVYYHTGGNCLILAPLAVSRQTLLEARKFNIQAPIKVCSDQSSVEAGITITNYEKLHKFDAESFVLVALDEGSILKSIDGKTRDLLIRVFQKTPYRYVFTATPSPNDLMEIGSYCEFLGIMTRAEMLAMFFVHDGGDTSKWRLKGHAEKRFFEWMASWAVMLRKPSDIGYSDEGYILPPLTIHEHVIESAATSPGYLFQMEARTLNEQREARRSTISERVELLKSLANADVNQPWISWCDLNDESKAAAGAIDGCIEITGSQPDYLKEKYLIDFTEGLKRAVSSKPSIAGFGLNWQHCNKMSFLGVSNSWEQFYQAIRRIYRFGQKQPCDVHLITTNRDGAVIKNLKRKQAESERLIDGMVAAMANFTKQQIESARREATEYQPQVAMELPSWL